MLEKGETPPNVRTDINDQPPNPTQPPPGTRLQPKPKPWERSRGPSVSSFPGTALGQFLPSMHLGHQNADGRPIMGRVDASNMLSQVKLVLSKT